MALVVLCVLLGGQTTAQKKAASLEPLLTVSDLAKIGLSGVVLAPPDAYDRTGQLGFLRSSDEWLVLNLSRFDVNSLGGGTLRSAVGVVSTDVVSVSGVGEEAYSDFDRSRQYLSAAGYRECNGSEGRCDLSDGIRSSGATVGLSRVPVGNERHDGDVPGRSQ